MFLDAGYSPQLFWDLSLGEVNDIIESYARRKEHEQKAREAELKDEIMLLFNQALQMGNVLGRLMNKETQLIMPAAYYPELYSNKKTEEAAETNFTEQESRDKPTLSSEMELHKARMDDYIFRHNLAFRERMAKERGESSGRNDLGKTASDHRGTD